MNDRIEKMAKHIISKDQILSNNVKTVGDLIKVLNKIDKKTLINMSEIKASGKPLKIVQVTYINEQVNLLGR